MDIYIVIQYICFETIVGLLEILVWQLEWGLRKKLEAWHPWEFPKLCQACWYYLAIYLNSVLVSICCSHSHQKCWCYVVSMWFPDCMFLFPLQICWGTTTTKSGEVQISIGAQSTKWQTQNPKWTCSQSLHFLQVPLQLIRLRHESSILGGILKSLTFRVGLGEQKFKQNHYLLSMSQQRNDVTTRPKKRSFHSWLSSALTGRIQHSCRVGRPWVQS